jgi:hypothetical protein
LRERVSWVQDQLERLQTAASAGNIDMDDLRAFDRAMLLPDWSRPKR